MSSYSGSRKEPRLGTGLSQLAALPEPEAGVPGVASDNRYPQTTAPPSAVQAQSAAYTIPITYSIHDHQYMMHRTHDNKSDFGFSNIVKKNKK